MPYCTNCGQQNPPSNKFCENCGSTLTQGSQPPPPPFRHPSGTRRRLPAAGSALVLICFFFPWVMVSCNVSWAASTSVSATGYEIATGNYSALQGLSNAYSYLGGAASQLPQTQSFPLLWAIPLLALAGLLCLNGRSSGTTVAVIAGILGAVGLIIFSIKASDLDRQLQLAAFSLRYREGYWGTWLGFLWQTGMALFSVGSRK